ncbi:MAG: 4Fe-4S dicluster domain-containing protein [Dehalococcoidia bacterium]|nr:4Fe-4S dicluster domain-containing protein [Dehalococcoidia bacterium]
MTVKELPQEIRPDSSFRKKVEALSGEKVSACFQCEKCTNGCPVSFAMDIVPHKLMRSVHLGLREQVLASDTIWVCASCETCTTRCPNSIDIAHVMDTLRQISRKEATPSQKNIPIFHDAFLASMKRFGRVHEASMAVTYALKSGGLKGVMDQAGTGMSMFKKGKVKVLPAKLGGNKQVKDIFRAAERKG